MDDAGPIQDTQPGTENPNLEDQSQEIKPTVMGPGPFGSPDPMTAAGHLAPVVDHPLKASFSEDYGADVIDESNKLSTVTGDETGKLTADSYDDMKVDDLKSLAKQRDIQGASSMNKKELVKAHEDYDEAQSLVDDDEDDETSDDDEQ